MLWLFGLWLCDWLSGFIIHIIAFIGVSGLARAISIDRWARRLALGDSALRACVLGLGRRCLGVISRCYSAILASRFERWFLRVSTVISHKKSYTIKV
jgi:hypothetical protein